MKDRMGPFIGKVLENLDRRRVQDETRTAISMCGMGLTGCIKVLATMWSVRRAAPDLND